MDFKWDKGGAFWGSFAKRAKEVLYEDESSKTQQEERSEAPTFQKGLHAIASSLSRIGDTLGTAIEESLNVLAPETIDNKVTEKPKNSTESTTTIKQQHQQDSSLDNQTQLKASRDVAMAMTSKVKLLMRELKEAKKNLAFMKDRCSQLEEENMRLRENLEKGQPKHEEDDLVRKQLEALVAEKARLSQENANYARENQFLHEVIEYHHLVIEDASLLDERIEQVAETIQTGM